MSKNKEVSLKEEVEDLVKKHGGWLSVIPKFTSSFDDGIKNLGKSVNCPFPHRHRKGGGINDFRFSDDAGYEGRAICSCLQDGGAGPVDLLILDGLEGGNFVAVMRKIKLGLKGSQPIEKPLARPVAAKSDMHDPEVVKKRANKLRGIAKDLLPLNHPDAGLARRYFEQRGIPVSSLRDVMFHPALEYNEDVRVGTTKTKKMIGRFPAVVSAFRDVNGNVVNLHKIYLGADGKKLTGVSKAKKIDSPLPGYKGSAIRVATVEGCRTLHVTEGCEKGIAIHLATKQSVWAVNSCTMLPTLAIPQGQFDRVVIWSDNDPYIEARERHGDGQTFAWKLFVELLAKGYQTGFMLPMVEHVDGAKAEDWEDLIVKNRVTEMPIKERFPFLRTLADAGGLFQCWKSVA